jgi:hypothetical protein
LDCRKLFYYHISMVFDMGGGNGGGNGNGTGKSKG